MNVYHSDSADEVVVRWQNICTQLVAESRRGGHQILLFLLDTWKADFSSSWQVCRIGWAAAWLSCGGTAPPCVQPFFTPACWSWGPATLPFYFRACNSLWLKHEIHIKCWKILRKHARRKVITTEIKKLLVCPQIWLVCDLAPKF